MQLVKGIQSKFMQMTSEFSLLFKHIQEVHTQFSDKERAKIRLAYHLEDISNKWSQYRQQMRELEKKKQHLERTLQMRSGELIKQKYLQRTLILKISKLEEMIKSFLKGSNELLNKDQTNTYRQKLDISGQLISLNQIEEPQKSNVFTKALYFSTVKIYNILHSFITFNIDFQSHNELLNSIENQMAIEWKEIKTQQKCTVQFQHKKLLVMVEEYKVLQSQIIQKMEALKIQQLADSESGDQNWEFIGGRLQKIQRIILLKAKLKVNYEKLIKGERVMIQRILKTADQDNKLWKICDQFKYRLLAQDISIQQEQFQQLISNYIKCFKDLLGTGDQDYQGSVFSLKMIVLHQGSIISSLNNDILRIESAFQSKKKLIQDGLREMLNQMYNKIYQKETTHKNLLNRSSRLDQSRHIKDTKDRDINLSQAFEDYNNETDHKRNRSSMKIQERSNNILGQMTSSRIFGFGRKEGHREDERSLTKKFSKRVSMRFKSEEKLQNNPPIQTITIPGANKGQQTQKQRQKSKEKQKEREKEKERQTQKQKQILTKSRKYQQKQKLEQKQKQKQKDHELIKSTIIVSQKQNLKEPTFQPKQPQFPQNNILDQLKFQQFSVPFQYRKIQRVNSIQIRKQVGFPFSEDYRLVSNMIKQKITRGQTQEVQMHMKNYMSLAQKTIRQSKQIQVKLNQMLEFIQSSFPEQTEHLQLFKQIGYSGPPGKLKFMYEIPYQITIYQPPQTQFEGKKIIKQEELNRNNEPKQLLNQFKNSKIQQLQNYKNQNQSEPPSSSKTFVMNYKKSNQAYQYISVGIQTQNTQKVDFYTETFAENCQMIRLIQVEISPEKGKVLRSSHSQEGKDVQIQVQDQNSQQHYQMLALSEKIKMSTQIIQQKEIIMELRQFKDRFISLQTIHQGCEQLQKQHQKCALVIQQQKRQCQKHMQTLNQTIKKLEAILKEKQFLMEQMKIMEEERKQRVVRQQMYISEVLKQNPPTLNEPISDDLKKKIIALKEKIISLDKSLKESMDEMELNAAKMHEDCQNIKQMVCLKLNPKTSHPPKIQQSQEQKPSS